MKSLKLRGRKRSAKGADIGAFQGAKVPYSIAAKKVKHFNNPYQTTEIPEQGLSFLTKPFFFILLIWVVFWVDQRFMLELYQFGILPRHVEGLPGVLVSPLLHGNMVHISNNTLPLLALGAGLFYFYPRIALFVIITSWVSSGLAVWIIGRESYHIGASSLIYALAGFIFLSGILRKQPNLLALSLLVVFLYGGLVWGIFPIRENVSWEAHLAGASSGFALAIHFRKLGPVRKKYSWELEEEGIEDVKFEEIKDYSAKDVNGEEPKEKPEEKQDEEAWNNYGQAYGGIRYFYRPNDEQKSDPSSR